MVSEEVDYLNKRSIKPKRIIIVDAGSTDQELLSVLNSIEDDTNLKIPVKIIYHKNATFYSKKYWN